jgi:hypothetical protein
MLFVLYCLVALSWYMAYKDRQTRLGRTPRAPRPLRPSGYYDCDGQRVGE